jgi:hypothetical protein
MVLLSERGVEEIKHETGTAWNLGLGFEGCSTSTWRWKEIE